MPSRRNVLGVGAMAAIGLLGIRRSPALAAGVATDNALETAGPRYVIVNADNLGLSTSINRGPSRVTRTES
jgi:hypothetical protein